MKSKLKIVFNYISTIIIIFGILGFTFNWLIGVSLIEFNRELPLCDIQQIQETNNKIYIGLARYNRVQVYNLKGEYVTFIPVNNHSKDFDFTIDRNEHVNTFFIEQNQPSKIKFIQQDNSSYQLTSKFPLIISKTQKNKTFNVISQPWYFNLFGGSINTWLIGLFGVILLVLFNIITIMDVFGRNIDYKEKVKILRNKIYKI